MRILFEANAEFALDHSKIVATVTDNGANFVKAFREFAVRVRVMMTMMTLITTMNVKRQMDRTMTMLIFLKLATMVVTDESPVLVLPTHIKCASHTLSLVGTTDAAHAIKNSAAFSRLNHMAMGKCSALWNAGLRPKTAEKTVKFVTSVCKHPVPHAGTHCMIVLKTA